MLLFLLRPHHHSIKHRRQGRSKQLRKWKTLGGVLATRVSSAARLPSALCKPQKAPEKGPVAATLATAPWEVLGHPAVPDTPQVQMPAAERRWPHSNTNLQYSEGELRKSEAAPMCKAGACQPQAHILKGPIRSQGAQAAHSWRMTFLSLYCKTSSALFQFPVPSKQQNIPGAWLRKGRTLNSQCQHCLCKTLTSCSEWQVVANSHSTLPPRKATTQRQQFQRSLPCLTVA